MDVCNADRLASCSWFDPLNTIIPFEIWNHSGMLVARLSDSAIDEKYSAETSQVPLSIRQASSWPEAVPAVRREGPKGAEVIDHVGGGGGGGGEEQGERGQGRGRRALGRKHCWQLCHLSWGMGLLQSILWVQSMQQGWGGGGGRAGGR